MIQGPHPFGWVSRREWPTFLWSDSVSLSRRARGACLAAVLAVLAVLGGVVISTTPQCPKHCRTEAAAKVPRPAPSTAAAVVAVTPADGATDVDPAGPMFVVARSGTLDHVKMVNDWGKTVPGVLTPDEGLASDRTARLRAHLHHDRHRPRPRRHAVTRQTSSFTTVSPGLPDRGQPQHHRGQSRSWTATPTASASSSSRTSTSRSPTRSPPRSACTSPPTRRSPGPGTGSTTRTPTGGPRSITRQALPST